MSIPRSRFLQLMLGSGVVVLALACGSDDPVNPGNDNDNGNNDDDDDGALQVIGLSGTSFTPSTVTISVGTTVRWTNNDGVDHTVTPDGHNEWQRWETGSSGETFEHTFNTPGTYDYFCEPHQGLGMTGTITVE